MAGIYNRKLKLIYTLEILKQYSDDENPVNAVDIVEKLAEMGVSAERKSIYDDIAALEDYGYDIIKTSTPKKGWFLGDREFEVPEIYLLCDAVRSAKFINAKKTRELISKLNSMLSVYQVKRRGRSVFYSLADKRDNKDLYYNIDSISYAIEHKKQIKLTNAKRVLSKDRQIITEKKSMIINPYALTWQEDHYYLIGNYAKYDNLIHLRLDRIGNVEILDTPARHFSEVSDYSDSFDISDYTNKLFGMYSGEESEIELCCNKSITEQVLDRFSEAVFIKNVTDDTFNLSVNAVISEALVTWIINYGSNLKVVKPNILKEMVLDRVNQVLENYKD